MSDTYNTKPYMYQRDNMGRDWRNCVSQRDIRIVSKIRKKENRRARAKDNHLMRNGRFDDLSALGSGRRNAVWLAW